MKFQNKYLNNNRQVIKKFLDVQIKYVDVVTINKSHLF